MSLIYVPERKIQSNFSPDFPVEVNRGNPLAEGLRALFLPAVTNYDLASGLPFSTYGTPPTIITSSGKALLGSTSGTAYAGLYASDQTSTGIYSKTYDVSAPPITLFGLGYGIQNTSDAFIVRGNGSGVPAYSAGVYYGSANGGRAQVKTSGGSITFTAAADVFDVTKPTLIVLSIGATTTRMRAGYVGSILDSPADQPTPSGNFYYEYSDIYRCLSVAGNFTAAAGVLMSGMVVGRAWGDAEIQSFFDKPFQLLRPKSKSIWGAVSSGGGGTTLALASNTTAQSSSSAALTINIAPSASTSSQSNSNAALTIAEQLAATTANQDSSSAMLGIATALATSSSNQSASNAQLGISIPLTANIGNQASSSATLTAAGSAALGSATANQAVSNAALTIGTPLNAQTAAQSGSVANPIIPVALVATAQSIGTATPALSLQIAVSSQVANQALANAALGIAMPLATQTANMAYATALLTAGALAPSGILDADYRWTVATRGSVWRLNGRQDFVHIPQRGTAWRERH